MSRANAERAGVADFTDFRQVRSATHCPCEKPVFVIVIPPYGARIGDKTKLFPLYHTLGKTLMTLLGLRVGIIATEPVLAHATELPFLPPPRRFSTADCA